MGGRRLLIQHVSVHPPAFCVGGEEGEFPPISVFCVLACKLNPPFRPPSFPALGPAWKYTAPEIPILNLANVLLGSQPTLKPVAKPGQL